MGWAALVTQCVNWTPPLKYTELPAQSSPSHPILSHPSAACVWMHHKSCCYWSRALCCFEATTPGKESWKLDCVECNMRQCTLCWWKTKLQPTHLIASNQISIRCTSRRIIDMYVATHVVFGLDVTPINGVMWMSAWHLTSFCPLTRNFWTFTYRFFYRSTNVKTICRPKILVSVLFKRVTAATCF